MRPIIGVIPLWDDTKESIWMIPGYMDAVSQAGALPIILPLNVGGEEVAQLCQMCSGFVLTGGHDVDPAIYGQPQSERCGRPCEARDSLEREVVEYALANDRPLLGICRGIQLLNALLGGTLYQDLPTEHEGGVEHQMTPPYHRVQHYVDIVEGSPLAQLVGQRRLGVNSYHHQAIERLSPQLEAMATSEDGLIEAVYMPTRSFVQAVQWHPELNFRHEESSRQIMRAFVEACRR
ncbi:MAG: gamma-glutamyl-gamma-aminobutyrate hydrolase family protein [Rikenellaceae bacterium]